MVDTVLLLFQRGSLCYIFRYNTRLFEYERKTRKRSVRDRYAGDGRTDIFSLLSLQNDEVVKIIAVYARKTYVSITAFKCRNTYFKYKV